MRIPAAFGPAKRPTMRPQVRAAYPYMRMAVPALFVALVAAVIRFIAALLSRLTVIGAMHEATFIFFVVFGLIFVIAGAMLFLTNRKNPIS